MTMRNEIKKLLVDGLGQLRWQIEQQQRQGKALPPYVQFLIDGDYGDLPPEHDKWWQSLLPYEGNDLHTLQAQFERIAADGRITGVILHLRSLPLSQAQLQTLRDMIGALRDKGKRVIAWSPSYDMATYYVACAADEILLLPGGTVAPIGLRRKLLHFKDTLDEIGVKMDAVQISPFKSGPDTFTRSEPTEASREMANWLIDDQFEVMLEGIAASRGLTLTAVRQLIDEAPYTDLQALEAGVIDGVLNEEALPHHLGIERLERPIETWEKAEKAIMPLRPAPRQRQHVALLRIEGMIVPGESRRPPLRTPLFAAPTQSGDLTVVQRIRNLREDDEVGAVLLWVDSPGGSATASEAMASALEQIAAEKPLVAAFGTMAASGGYYVSTPAQWVVAQPSTITGSIGVFSLKPVVNEMLDKLHVGREALSRGRHADLFDPEQPFSAEGEQKMEESIARIYELFIQRVAAARKMTVEEVDAIGGGRVWTGRQAFAHGLVDELGGFERALARAKSLAQLPDAAPLRPVLAPKAALAAMPAPQALATLLRAQANQPLCLSPFWLDSWR